MARKIFLGGHDSGTGKAAIWEMEPWSGTWTKSNDGLEDSGFTNFKLDADNNLHAVGGLHSSRYNYNLGVYAKYDGISWTNYDVYRASWLNTFSDSAVRDDGQVFLGGYANGVTKYDVFLYDPATDTLSQFNLANPNYAKVRGIDTFTTDDGTYAFYVNSSGLLRYWKSFLWVGTFATYYDRFWNGGNGLIARWPLTGGIGEWGNLFVVADGYYRSYETGWARMPGSPTTWGMIGWLWFVDTDDIWATYYYVSGASAYGRVYHWDGTIWTQKLTVGSDYVDRVAASGQNVIATGMTFGGNHKGWYSDDTGSTWSSLPLPATLDATLPIACGMSGDTTPPELTPIYPTNNLTLVSVSSSISFNLTDDFELATGWYIDINRGAGWERVLLYDGVNFNWSDEFTDTRIQSITGGYQISFTPVIILPYNKDIQIRATAQDTAGNDVVLA